MRTSKFLALRTISILMVLCCDTVARAQDAPSAEDAFKRANELTQASRYREAIPLYLIAYSAFPDSDAVVWNLGISSAQLGEQAEALKYWMAYRKLRPDDWQSFSKLIQTYQALGDIASRDRERAALLELRRSAQPESALAQADMYCREQMEIAGKKILAFEFFAPKGERMVIYKFVVTKADGTEDYRYSLGSYDATNHIAWETGSLPKDKRVYHLDKYQDRNHWTYGFYQSQPSYETIRSSVDNILNGQTTPISSTILK